jgi:hypothetical protein
MKKIIDNFKKGIRFIVTIFASREFAFIYAVLGVFSQIAHTYYLTSSVSSFTGWFNVFQAVLLSTFISSSLLYFIAIIDNSDTRENKNNKLAVSIFVVIEIAINLYYYSRHLLIDVEKIQIFDFIFAILISAFIPVTIKLFGSHIRAKEWTEEISDKTNILESNSVDIEQTIMAIIDREIKKINIDDQMTEESIEKFILEKTEELKKTILSDIDSDIVKIFSKNQELFLQQFENKMKLITSEIK